jgi:hypothetical protein
VTCTETASVALLAGNIDGVALDVKEEPIADAGELTEVVRQPTGIAIFPVRKGDRKVLQFNHFEHGVRMGYQPTPDTQGPGHTLTVAWVDDEPGPHLEID